MLAIVYRGIAIPILWTLLNKRGNSDTKERGKRENVLDDHDFNYIQKALLQHRRQHNIFEVGDKVVIKAEPFWPEDYIIQTVGQEHIGKWYMAAWKHATDAEIKAGKRLEVNQ